MAKRVFSNFNSFFASLLYLHFFLQPYYILNKDRSQLLPIAVILNLFSFPLKVHRFNDSGIIRFQKCSVFSNFAYSVLIVNFQLSRNYHKTRPFF